MNGTVYLIRNKINHKVYVGQTVKPVQQRFSEHRYNHKSKSNKPLHRAIIKYGLDSFEFMILVTGIKSQKVLDAVEIQQIKLHNSLIPKGYNIKEGGANAPKPFSLSDDKLNEFLRIERNKSLGYLAGYFGVSVRAIQNFIKRHSIERQAFRRKDKTRNIDYDTFIQMYNSNLLVSEIAYLLEVSQSKVYTFIKQHNISKRFNKSSNIQ